MLSGRRWAICAAVGLALIAGAAGCSKGRESRLLDVLTRSRSAPERIVELEGPFLADPDSDVRALAVWAIGDSDASGAAAAIMPLAADPEAPVRLAVAKALCKMKAHTSPDVLMRLAADADVSTRRVAVRCVVSDETTDPQILIRALQDTDQDVRRTVLASLVLRPRAGTLPGLLGVLQLRPAEDRIEAAKALRALADPAALPVLDAVASEHLPSAVRDVVEPTILELRAVKARASLAQEEAEPGAAKDAVEPNQAN